MLGNVHAIILLALPIATVAACVALYKERTTWRHVAAAPCVGFVIGLGGSMLSVHACARGTAVAQCWVPAACLTAILISVSRSKVQWAASVLVVVLICLLVTSYTRMVHGPEYIGNRHWDQVVPAVKRKLQLRAVAQRLEGLAADEETLHPPGWLSEARFVATKPYEFAESAFAGERIEAVPLWHSWLTGLYRQRRVRVEMWYPGGRLSDAANRIEYRDRGEGQNASPG